jgi:ABC-type polar amino acid transport system ATPase subunit
MITISGLVKDHGKNRILDGVDLVVKKGQVTAVIGPSGGGKSTLLRCINALECFQQGSIQVGDIALTPDSIPKVSLLLLRRTVGMVFQQFNLFPHMTALENVMAGPFYVLNQSEKQAEERARELLTRVGLPDKLNSKPDELSGGQQQRVAIARALAVNPSAILFDEPTSALDPIAAQEVLGVITDLAKLGQTMIVVTHAMNFARRVADQVVVMHAGKVAESGPPDEVFGNPKQEVTRDFLSRENK